MYTSIKINTGNTPIGKDIGVKIPSTLGYLEKGKKYTLQFKCRSLVNNNTLDRIKVGGQLLESININDFKDVKIKENITAKLCYISFISDKDINYPSIEIARLRTNNDSVNTDILEITDIQLNFGNMTNYSPSTGDFLLLKSSLETKIKQLSENIILSANKEDVDQLSGKIKKALAQIQVQAGQIDLKVEKDGLMSELNLLSNAFFINAYETVIKGAFTTYDHTQGANQRYVGINYGKISGYSDATVGKPRFSLGFVDPALNIPYIAFSDDTAGQPCERGRLMMRADSIGQGRIDFERLINNEVKSSRIIFPQDGSVYFQTDNWGNLNHPFVFEGNISTENISSGNITCANIYFRGNDAIHIGSSDYSAYSVHTNRLQSTNFNLSLWAGKGTWGSMQLTEDGYFRPSQNNGYSIGSTNQRISTIYLTNSPSVSSDSRAKTDIHYLDEPTEGINVIDNETPRVERNMNITTKDMYDFVKDDLRLASYRYNTNLERGITTTDYGFIAQDILCTRVGSEIVQLTDKNDLDSELSYNQGNYISVIAGALQEEIKFRDNQIEVLEKENKNLKSRLDNIEKILSIIESRCING